MAAKASAVRPDFDSTTEIPVPKVLVDQVIGQEKATEIIRKAAAQKRNVLLVGLPGTGKSMLAQAMAELLPVQQLHDILIYPNEVDPNNPKVRVVRANEGAKIVNALRLESKAQEDNVRLLGFLLPFAWFLLTSVIWNLKWISDVVYAATLILGGFLLVGFALGSQMRVKSGAGTPKLLIDNAGKRIAPFLEATGARAGALLGDVRHDPLQCHYGFNKLYLQRGNRLVEKTFIELWEEMRAKPKQEITRNEKGYEAIMLPDDVRLFTLGYKDGKVIWSRILSLNRQPFEGELVDIKAGGKTVSLTPEHEVYAQGADKEAADIAEGSELTGLEKARLVQPAPARA